MLGSSASTGEMQTSVLPQIFTDGGITSPTAHTTLLSAQPSTEKLEPTVSPKRLTLKLIVAVCAIVVFAFIVFAYLSRRSRPTTFAQIQSIAVMPFVNDSGNPDLEYLSDGMTETLISSLSQLPNLTVKARSTVFRFKGKQTDPKTVGNELNVPAILNGRVGQRGDQLTLSLELIDVATENVIWSEQYDRKQADLISLQKEIARDVSSKLKTKLSGTDREKLGVTYTTNPEAYKLYLQGRFYWNRREEKDLRNAIDCFNRAITIDDNYALAYVGLADSYALLSSFNFSPPPEAIPKAREFANKALSLDASLAEAHTTLGLTYLQFEYDFASAEREYKSAIQLNSNYATAHQWYGEMLTCAGRFDEAATEFRRALELEPLSLPINWDYGRFFYNSRRFDEALAQHKKTIELDGSFARVRRTLVEIYRVRHDYANATAEFVRYFELRGQPENASLVRETFAKTGWNGILQLVVAPESPLKERNWARAKAYVELGDKGKAFAELNAAFENRESTLVWIMHEPQFDPLRSDPRYQQLLQKMGVAK